MKYLSFIIGMNIGATRKIADMKIDDMSRDGQGIINLQVIGDFTKKTNLLT